MTTTTNDKMVNVMTQTTFGDDMPEYISIYDRPKKPKGRPKNKIQLTDEDKKERMRKLASRHYYENHELRKFQQTQNNLRKKHDKEQTL